MRHNHKSTYDCIDAYYAQQASWGQNGKRTVWFEGDNLYSYGRHFVLAKRIAPGAYLLSTRRYSISTSRHQWKARRRGGINSYYVNDAGASPEANVAAHICDYRNELRVAARRRDPQYKAENWTHQEFRRYLEVVGRLDLMAQIESLEYERPEVDTVKHRFTLATYGIKLPFKDALRLAEFRDGMLIEAGTRDDGTVRLPASLRPKFGSLAVDKIDQEWVTFANGARLPHQTISYMAEVGSHA